MKFKNFGVQIGPADGNITRDQLPIFPLLLSLLLLTPCYGYLELMRHNNELSEDDGRPQGVGEDLSRREYIANDEIDNKRQRRDTYTDAGSGSQGTNCTLILNGTDNSTDFSHSLGIYFTGCKCCEYDSDCCVNGSNSGYNNMRYDCSEGEVCCHGSKYFIVTNRNLTYNDDQLNTSHCINASDIWCTKIVNDSQDSSRVTTEYVISSSTHGSVVSITCYSANIVTSSPETTPLLSDSMISSPESSEMTPEPTMSSCTQESAINVTCNSTNIVTSAPETTTVYNSNICCTEIVISSPESSEMTPEPTMSSCTQESAIHKICYCDSTKIVTSSTKLTTDYGSTNGDLTATAFQSSLELTTTPLSTTINTVSTATTSDSEFYSDTTPVETSRMTQGVGQTTKLTAVTTQATTIAIGMTVAETSTVLQTPTMTPNLTTAPVETSRMMHGVDQTTKLTAVTTQATTIAIQPSPQSTTAPVPTGVSRLSSATVLITESVSSIATGMTAAETSTVFQTPTMTPNFTTTDDLVVQLGIGLGITAVVVVVVCVIVVFVLIYIW